MSRREDVDNAIWSEEPFSDLSPHGKLLYLWGFTNPHCNMAGLYKVASKVMALETSLAPRALDAALAEVREAQLMFYERGIVWVRSRVKYLRTRTTMMARSIAKDVEKLSADEPLRIAFLAKYADFPWLRDELSQFPTVEPNPEYLSNTSMEPHQRFQGNGKGKGTAVSNTRALASEPDFTAEFEVWLTHHQQVTGDAPPGPKTKARKAIAASFAERRKEDLSLDDLKYATIGAYTDRYRREHGYYDPESVLRPKSVHKLSQKGKRHMAAQRSTDSPEETRRRLEEANR